MPMSQFGNTLFSASPFIRWALSPFLFAFACLLPWFLLAKEVDAMKIVVVVGLEILALAVLLGLWAPSRIGHIAFRLACLVVFLGYAAYLFAELFSGKSLSIPRSRGESSPVNALLGCVLIGLPALRYALWGRFKAEAAETSSDDESLDDSSLNDEYEFLEEEDAEPAAPRQSSPPSALPLWSGDDSSPITRQRTSTLSGETGRVWD